MQRERPRRLDGADCWAAERIARASWLSRSFVCGCLGHHLLKLNPFDGVSARGFGKGFRRLVGRVVFRQQQRLVFNPEDGEDHGADAIRWGRTLLDRGV